jgi:hypothetical protein
VGESQHSGEIFLNDGRAFFVKMKSKSVRAWGFILVELIQGSENFNFLYGPV